MYVYVHGRNRWKKGLRGVTNFIDIKEESQVVLGGVKKNVNEMEGRDL